MLMIPLATPQCRALPAETSSNIPDVRMRGTDFIFIVPDITRRCWDDLSMRIRLDLKAVERIYMRILSTVLRTSLIQPVRVSYARVSSLGAPAGSRHPE